MIQVRIVSVSADAISGQPVVLLRPLDDAKAGGDTHVLPIWIGHPEATAILIALQGAEFPRPMTHDLLLSAIKATGFSVTRIEVNRLDGGTYYATITLYGENGDLAIDARPSDSLALAVRAGCPIYVAESVLAEASVVIENVDEEEEVEEFRNFLDHVDPSDFMS
ncbi:MAG: bifunctional nuclease family protein [Coriobacteriia bacterium]|nr:bifunctional nuclease family protein [Coriobacteriia bacterium]